MYDNTLTHIPGKLVSALSSKCHGAFNEIAVCKLWFIFALVWPTPHTSTVPVKCHGHLSDIALVHEGHHHTMVDVAVIQCYNHTHIHIPSTQPHTPTPVHPHTSTHTHTPARTPSIQCAVSHRNRVTYTRMCMTGVLCDTVLDIVLPCSTSCSMCPSHFPRRRRSPTPCPGSNPCYP
jgi:hypothetical protein